MIFIHVKTHTLLWQKIITVTLNEKTINQLENFWTWKLDLSKFSDGPVYFELSRVTCKSERNFEYDVNILPPSPVGEFKTVQMFLFVVFEQNTTMSGQF